MARGTKLTVKHIPGIERGWLEKLMRRKSLIEAFGAVPPISIAGIGAYRLANEQATQSIGYWSAGIAIWLLFASMLKIVNARESDKDAEAKRNHDGLRAAILVLQASAGRACGLGPNNVNDLRVTFHAVVPPLANAQEIEQLVPYAGGDGGGEGRR